VLEYVKSTIDLTYTIGADDIGRMRTWVDASFAVHGDMKSHTGGVVSFGRGGLMCKSRKQTLNVKSSTEAEQVGASDYLPNPIWAKAFLEAQGYPIVENFFEQDNESAIKLEKNGRLSAGPKSRHVNIRYFWIKDRVVSEGITIRHCPTAAMLAYFFTKPLQGGLFRKFRDVLLGHAHVASLVAVPTVPPEERVGIQRANSHGTEPMEALDNSTVHARTVSWADVVKKPPATTHLAGNVQRHAYASRQNSKIVLRSLSRNNPVNRIKV
jgi:hypothetical protein